MDNLNFDLAIGENYLNDATFFVVSYPLIRQIRVKKGKRISGLNVLISSPEL